MNDLTKPGGCIKEILKRLIKHRKKMEKEYGDDYYHFIAESAYDEMIEIVKKIQIDFRSK